MSYEIGTATDYADFLAKLNTFLTAKGQAFGLSYAGTGNGTFGSYSGGASSVAETFTITATSSTSFDVIGSVSGSIGPATVGSAFTHAKINFTITAGGVAFVAGDAFKINTAPKWSAVCAGTGVAFATATTDTTVYAYNAFSGAGSTGWVITATSGVLEFDFYSAKTIAEYAVTHKRPTLSEAPKTWTFEYWNGSAWVVLDTRSSETSWTVGQTRAYTIASPVSASKYRLNITANNGLTVLSVGQLQLRTSIGGADQCETRWVWVAPGNDGNSAIYVGAVAFSDIAADYHNLQLGGFIGYDATKSFTQQPGAMTDVYLPLYKTALPYWFSANGRSIRIEAKVSTVYVAGYMGFIEPYFSPGEYPYPLCVGGSLAFSNKPATNNANWRWSATGDRAHVYAIGYSVNGTTTPTFADYQMRLRYPDGSWNGHGSLFSGSSQSTSAAYATFPYGNGMLNWAPNLDGSYSVIPIIFHTSVAGVTNTWGRLDGVYAVTGNGNTAEASIAASGRNFVVFPDIYRGTNLDYFAMELD